MSNRPETGNDLSLSEQNEAEMIQILKRRFYDSSFFVNIGSSICLYINPWSMEDHKEDVIPYLENATTIEILPPHVYSLVSSAYQRLQSGQNQNIILRYLGLILAEFLGLENLSF